MNLHKMCSQQGKHSHADVHAWHDLLSHYSITNEWPRLFIAEQFNSTKQKLHEGLMLKI